MKVNCQEEEDMIIRALCEAKKIGGNMPRECFYQIIESVKKQAEEKFRRVYDNQLVKTR